MASLLLPLPPPQALLHRRSSSQPPGPIKPPTTTTSTRSSSSSSSRFRRSSPLQAAPSSSRVAEAEESSLPSPVEGELIPGADTSADGAEKLSFRGCKTCGREAIEKGCNGEGRIQGGVATVPGFSWWPIKAYRPCPGFLASGGRYRRQGQSMDEVAFGRGERERLP